MWILGYILTKKSNFNLRATLAQVGSSSRAGVALNAPVTIRNPWFWITLAHDSTEFEPSILHHTPAP